jgi:peptidoglycan-associated lipoprotein
MKKVLALFLLVFVVGCAQRYTKDEPVYREAARSLSDLFGGKAEKEEVVEEETAMSEEDIQEVDLDADEERVITSEEIKLVFKDILFDYDKYTIRPDSRDVLDSVAKWLTANHRTKIILEGHCDERGTNEYNLALGEKRAKAARDYLISLGVSSSRMTVITYGEEKPVCTAHNEACWQLNRRAHFVVTE